MKQMQRSKEKHRRSGHFGGADTARLVRLLGTNFTNHETVADLCRMADHFCAETDTLLNRTFYIETDDGHVVPGYFQVDKNEQHLIEMFRSMNNKGRQKFIDYLDDLVKNENNLLSSAPTAKSGA